MELVVTLNETQNVSGFQSFLIAPSVLGTGKRERSNVVISPDWILCVGI